MLILIVITNLILSYKYTNKYLNYTNLYIKFNTILANIFVSSCKSIIKILIKNISGNNAGDVSLKSF